MRYWNALVNYRSVVFQQVSETRESVQLNIWSNGSISLSDWRLDFFVNQLNNRRNVLLKGFIVRSDWESTEGDIALTSVFALSFLNIVGDVFNSLGQTVWTLVVIWNKAIHRRNQIDTLLLYQNLCRLFKHLLHLINDLLTLIHNLNYLNSGALLSNQFA